MMLGVPRVWKGEPKKRGLGSQRAEPGEHLAKAVRPWPFVTSQRVHFHNSRFWDRLLFSFAIEFSNSIAQDVLLSCSTFPEC